MAISRTAMFAFSRKAAVIAATSFVVLLAFFTVPFSQTSELGANIIFKFDPPLDDAQARCDQFANAGELLGLNPDQESPTFAMVVKVGEGGLESLEVTALAEGGLTADEVIAKLQSQYPFLAQATVTINPIMEYSESTLFGRLLGDTDLRIECEGKTAEEIKAEIEAILAGRGLENPKVEVIKTGTEGPTKIKISAPAGCCKK